MLGVILTDGDRETIDRIVGEHGLEVDSISEHSAGAGHSVDVTIVVDGDTPVGLDDLAAVSGALDAPAQTWGTPSQTVVLEVTSRGVDTPLTEAKHWRRNRARKVRVRLDREAAGPDVMPGAGTTVDARIGDVDAEAGRVWLVHRDGKRLHAGWVDLGVVVSAVVQVEFSSPLRGELDLLVAQ